MESITAALEQLDRGHRTDAPGARLHIQRHKEVLKIRDRRRFQIRPENADALAAAFPQPGEDLHAIIPGDFAFGDLLARLIIRFGCPRTVNITTLSLSEDNVHMLLGLLGNPDVELVLVLSHYFQATSDEIWRAIESMLIPHERCRVAVSRQHTKLILLDYGDRVWTVAGSANLRSSGCFEQLAVFTDRAVFEFYREWITGITAAHLCEHTVPQPALVPL